MTVKELKEKLNLKVLVEGDSERTVDGCYCGDLLSWVMSRINENDVWLTVMGNINSIAVCVLSDCSCIVLTENASLDEDAKLKAEAMNIPVLQSEESTYSLAVKISKLL
ncbi:MAG: hypothetical protein IJ962_06115 [Clostridia bacterium]|nr:hypothetical protein [Clostridia bacterium]MBR2418631.1 hypothetical protein [Clostridia bacterium]